VYVFWPITIRVVEVLVGDILQFKTASIRVGVTSNGKQIAEYDYNNDPSVWKRQNTFFMNDNDVKRAMDNTIKADKAKEAQSIHRSPPSQR
jgi:hypothetical protein